MAAGTFIITEVRRSNGATVADGERFEWTSDRDPPSTARGGARAAPLGAWALGVHQQNVRTDYSGARTPSWQVLGPRRKPFTLTGKWDDRYNYAGYAVETLRRFEELAERGNIVRFQFQRQVLEGLIEDFDPEYVREGLIRYTFTVSVAQRPDRYNPNRSPAGPLTPAQRFEEVDLAVAALQEVHGEVPSSALSGQLATLVADDLAEITADRNGLGATLDQRDLRPSESPTDTLPRLATSFRMVGARAQQILDTLSGIRSDLDAAYMTAASVLNFETWSRSMRWNARLLLGRSIAGAEDMDERAEPEAERVYRPQEGESLYSVSRRFYGTPHAWELIAKRNGLTSFKLTGDELLIIPERG